MRNYVQRSATSAMDTINIMNPLPFHQRSATGRVPNHWQDLYQQERPKDANVEGAVVSLIGTRRLIPTEKVFLPAFGDQGREDSQM
jgi:hypothetical protein